LRIAYLSLIISIPWIVAAQTDPPHRLEPEKTIERTLTGGSSDSYTLDLHLGDLVALKITDKGQDVILSVFGPAGDLNRAFSSEGMGGGTIRFFAVRAGSWRVRVAARSKDTPATYVISDLKITSPLHVAPPPDPNESARIKGLKTGADVAAFWKEIGPEGSPLIESIKDDPKHRLVTFLWRGGDDTKGVLLFYQPCLAETPDTCMMMRVPGTDLWYKSLHIDSRARTYYLLVPNPPAFTRQTFGDPAIQDVLGTLRQRDPLNPRAIFDDPRDPDVIVHRGASVLEMPEAPPQPWIKKQPTIPEGKLDEAHIDSALLKNNRKLTVYTPPGYSKDARPYGLVLVFDGDTYLRTVPTPIILDNLIAARRIPPVVAVTIGNSARSTELPCNPVFADFLNAELVPWLRRNYNITSDPRGVTIGGSSYGGLAATYAGLRHPETFGNILSQSGSYWWTPPTDPSKPESFAPEADLSYVAQLFVASPKLPLRFYLDAGSMELDRSGQGGAILVPNRHLRDVLRAKGYEVFYQEFVGGHDYLSWRETLADGLILLLGTLQ
jgi:enterochelin esterase-like enzyme